MDFYAARVLFALCFLFTTSYPTANAYPMSSYDGYAFYQQGSAINELTDAIAVSGI